MSTDRDSELERLKLESDTTKLRVIVTTLRDSYRARSDEELQPFTRLYETVTQFRERREECYSRILSGLQ